MKINRTSREKRKSVLFPPTALREAAVVSKQHPLCRILERCFGRAGEHRLRQCYLVTLKMHGDLALSLYSLDKCLLGEQVIDELKMRV